MNLREQFATDPCATAREQMQLAWSEGRLGEISRPAASETEAPRDVEVAEHLETCPDCQKEARSMALLDDLLAESFRKLDLSTSLPSEDLFARMLREVEENPDAQLIRRIRRPVRTIFWITFFSLCLIAFCYLIARAYQVIG